MCPRHWSGWRVRVMQSGLSRHFHRLRHWEVFAEVVPPVRSRKTSRSSDTERHTGDDEESGNSSSGSTAVDFSQARDWSRSGSLAGHPVRSGRTSLAGHGAVCASGDFAYDSTRSFSRSQYRIRTKVRGVADFLCAVRSSHPKAFSENVVSEPRRAWRCAGSPRVGRRARCAATPKQLASRNVTPVYSGRRCSKGRIPPRNSSRKRHSSHCGGRDALRISHIFRSG